MHIIDQVGKKIRQVKYPGLKKKKIFFFVSLNNPPPPIRLSKIQCFTCWGDAAFFSFSGAYFFL